MLRCSVNCGPGGAICIDYIRVVDRAGGAPSHGLGSDGLDKMMADYYFGSSDWLEGSERIRPAAPL